MMLLQSVSEIKATRLSANKVPIEWHPNLPIYAAESVLEAEASQFGWIGGLDADGELRCALPYVILQKAGVRMVRFRTETIPLGDALELSEERTFLNGAVEYCRAIGADIIIPSGNTAIFRTYPDGAAAVPYGTFVNDLTQNEDAVLGAIRKSFRQNIRKASAAGVQIKTGMEYLDTSFRLIADTLGRSKEPFKAYSDFKKKILSLGQYVKVFVAEHDGIVQGCMVAPFSQHTAYNCYAGSRQHPTLGAMHLLHWEAIRQFRAMGVKRFDFQGVRISPEKGSKQEGIMHYKQGFGGKLVEGYLWKYPLRPLKSAIYNLGVKWLNGGDIVDREQGKVTTV